MTFACLEGDAFFLFAQGICVSYWELCPSSGSSHCVTLDKVTSLPGLGFPFGKFFEHKEEIQSG